jgi:hypothetical protein
MMIGTVVSFFGIVVDVGLVEKEEGNGTQGLWQQRGELKVG